MPFSRRDFLIRSTGFVTVSAMVPRWAVKDARLFEESVGAANPNRTLVVLELMGGNDGLNTVIPYTDSLYPTLRSRIGIPTGSVLSLDSKQGLNPVMTGLKALWDANRVAIVTNVGYPNSSLSHFQSRDIWHTADPLLAQRRGWLGRWADSVLAGSGNPLACTAISQSLPRTLLADHVGVPTFLSLASYQFQTDGAFPGDSSNQVNAFLAQNGSEYEIENTPSTLSGVGQDAISSSNILQTVGTGYVPAGAYPDNSLGSGLQLIAEIINANVGARILYITYGGFDNHSGEDVDHDPLLTDVSDSIKAFFDDLDGHGKSHDVLLMTWSEFGRRAQDNGSNGTDHGTSAPHFVVGDAVLPGIHGDPPDLAHLDTNGNLSIQNDFRSYYGTVLSDWLGADATAILGAGWPNLGFLNKSYA
ncbi:MAG TPA: DUF1501 domain-containing protein [Thermoanaerobaculia bacterium]|jgi:uncharacterized protein (DUF1501 family)